MSCLFGCRLHFSHSIRLPSCLAFIIPKNRNHVKYFDCSLSYLPFVPVSSHDNSSCDLCQVLVENVLLPRLYTLQLHSYISYILDFSWKEEQLGFTCSRNFKILRFKIICLAKIGNLSENNNIRNIREHSGLIDRTSLNVLFCFVEH